MSQWMNGVGAALLATLVWFPAVSVTQDDVLASAQPSSELDGLKFDARIDFPEKAPEPRLVLTATNAGGATVKKKLVVRLLETRIDPLARMMPSPKTVWEKEIELEVAAGKETRVSFGDPKFVGWPAKSAAADPNGRSTLKELVVISGDERLTLLSVTVPSEGTPTIK
jgi:hypothetical protein